MSVRVTDLAELDSATVRDETDLLAAMIEADSPATRASAGALRELVSYYSAIMAVKNQTEQERQRRSSSLSAALEDPTLADDDAIDRLVSNYRITRRPGEAASGTITVVVSQLLTTTVGVGTTFSARGREFRTETAYTARTSEDAVSGDTDRLLTLRGDGYWSFQIPVVASEDGVAGNLPKGALLDADPAPANFVLAQVVSDFVGGVDGETNESLLARAVVGVAARTLAGRESMRSMISDAFDGLVLSDSIIGMGDAEMLRDRHTILGVGMGGRVDWYTRTRDMPLRTETTMTATLVDVDGLGNGVWQLGIGRDEYPGLYDVVVRPLGSDQGELQLTLDSRSADLTTPDDADFVPDIEDALECVYSRYQAVVLRFTDPDTATPLLTIGSSTAEYTVVVRHMPSIADLQDHVSSRSVRNPMGDCLVKAPVPCFVSLGLTIRLRPGQTAPDTTLIANDLADVVNGWGFAGSLPASALTDVVHNRLPTGASLSSIDMHGVIRRPDGQRRRLRSSELLEIPDEPDVMSTPRTVALYLDPTDVVIELGTDEIPAV